MSRWHNFWKNLAGHFPKNKKMNFNEIFIPSIFNHDISYSTLRQTMGLQSPNYQGVYEPASSLIILNSMNNGRVSKEQQEYVLRHELYHSQQLISTTAGLVNLVLISARNNIFRSYIYYLNKTFNAGLWVPIKGWLDNLNTDNLHDWYDPNKEYYYVSDLKRQIGQIDSLLLAIGTFESNSVEDCLYWEARFPWANLYKDKSWRFCFQRSIRDRGFWPYGFTSLLEATALYRDLLYKYGNFFEVNKHITQQIRSIRLLMGNTAMKNTPSITYLGPFLLLEEYFQNEDAPPLHFVPIAAFWALNSSLPHLTLTEEIIGRKNESDLPWTEVDPISLFSTFLFEITDDLNRESQGNSLIDLAKTWEPHFYSNSNKIIHVDDIINEDVTYVEKIKDQSESIGKCFSVVFKDIKILKTKEERMKYFFSSPLNNYPTQGIEIVKNGNSPSQDKLDAYLLNTLAYHLIPISSFRSLNRFRLGKSFLCPSIYEPFNTQCPAKGICNGQFPGTIGMPPTCWFKNSIKQNLYLESNQIGTVDGEFESEEEVLRILNQYNK